MLHSALLGRPNIYGGDIQALNTPNIRADRHLSGKALNRPTAAGARLRKGKISWIFKPTRLRLNVQLLWIIYLAFVIYVTVQGGTWIHDSF